MGAPHLDNGYHSENTFVSIYFGSQTAQKYFQIPQLFLNCFDPAFLLVEGNRFGFHFYILVELCSFDTILWKIFCDFSLCFVGLTQYTF